MIGGQPKGGPQSKQLARDHGPRRLRVLVIAEAANPEWASVPLIGWSHSRALARVADAHLVTQIRNAAAIGRAGLVEGRDFTAVDSERIARPIWRLNNLLRGGAGRGWTVGTALGAVSYRYFERLVWRKFGSAIRNKEFDIVHRLTPVSPTVPSHLATLCRRAGTPFVLGPLNGGVPWPRGFGRERRKEREWLSYVRDAHRLVPGYRATRRNATAILVGSRDTLRQMPARYRRKCVYIPENGIDLTRFGAIPNRRFSVRPLRIAFVGRLVPYKGADMLLEAVATSIRDGQVGVDIIGDGPEMPKLKALVRREGIGAGVTFTGWVDHRDVSERLARAHVFGFPSIREFGGGVVLEAMALGVVPVVLNYGGPAELVTDETGFVLEMGSRSEIIDRLRKVMRRIVANPEALAPLSTGSRSRVMDHFTWDAKANQVLEVYRWVLGTQGKPDFQLLGEGERIFRDSDKVGA